MGSGPLFAKPIPPKALAYATEPRTLDNGCWILPVKPNAAGYVRVNIYLGGGRKAKRCSTFAAHRIFYARAKGPIPKGLTIDHVCKNRACVNPNHMEAVSMRENTLRGETRAAENAAKKRCGTCGSVYVSRPWGRGGRTRRVCQPCTARKQREYKVRLIEEQGKCDLEAVK